MAQQLVLGAGVLLALGLLVFAAINPGNVSTLVTTPGDSPADNNTNLTSDLSTPEIPAPENNAQESTDPATTEANPSSDTTATIDDNSNSVHLQDSNAPIDSNQMIPNVRINNNSVPVPPMENSVPDTNTQKLPKKTGIKPVTDIVEIFQGKWGKIMMSNGSPDKVDVRLWRYNGNRILILNNSIQTLQAQISVQHPNFNCETVNRLLYTSQNGTYITTVESGDFSCDTTTNTLSFFVAGIEPGENNNVSLQRIG